ncbi:hypothetical protein [uncultured Prevotella sp.]|uniref:hypothetical protein n=1 Tax=uncultured Prevotella sp. TaxID=159272 RepID=UPI0028044B8F|nr:hypothetical protein [uncultured Prevotella sp.]
MGKNAIESSLNFLNGRGIQYATVLLTENILRHSIFDANKQIRELLKSTGLHDFGTQQKGVEHKVYVSTHILTFMRDIPSQTSLYKAGTRGDNRMWFGSKVFEVSKPDSVFAIFVYNCELYIINITTIDINACFTSSLKNPIKDFLNKILQN